MQNINTLIDENRTNHFKLLTIVGNNKVKIERLVNYLSKKGWQVYDLEEVILELVKDMPEEKIRLRIGTALKKWIKACSNRTVLINANILYSEDMDRRGPFEEFKYAMRGQKEGILFLDAKLRGKKAIYSTPDRPDYKITDLSDVLSISLDEVTLEEE